MRILASLALVGLLAVPAMAQSTLTITGTLCPGDTITASVSGAPADSPTVLFVGENAGSTTLGGGMLQVTIDLDPPFVPIFMGDTDANGDVSKSVTIPSGIPASVLPSSLESQAVTADVSFGMGPPSITFVTSNTATIPGGGCP